MRSPVIQQYLPSKNQSRDIGIIQRFRYCERVKGKEGCNGWVLYKKQPDTWMVKVAWEEAPVGRRPSGRPRMRWRGKIKTDRRTIWTEYDPALITMEAHSTVGQDPPLIVESWRNRERLMIF